MKVLLDTNVLIDYILDRQPFSDSAEKIILFCKDKMRKSFAGAFSKACRVQRQSFCRFPKAEPLTAGGTENKTMAVR